MLDWHSDNTLRPPDATELYSTDVFADHAIEILKEIAMNNEQLPFTLSISFNAPHSPVHEPPHTPSWISIIEPQRIFDPSLDVKRKNYISMVAALDARIGDIIHTLKTEMINGHSLWSNTWLWLLSDNGGGNVNGGSSYPLRGSKSTLFEGGIRVCFLYLMICIGNFEIY